MYSNNLSAILMPRLITILTSLFLSIGSGQLLAEENISTKAHSDDKQDCQLTFGFTEWKPLQYLDASGNPAGIQVSLMKKIL